MISRTAFWPRHASETSRGSHRPIPPTDRRRPGSCSMMSKTACRRPRRASREVRADALHEAGAEVLLDAFERRWARTVVSVSGWNCRPCTRSLTHAPLACTNSRPPRRPRGRRPSRAPGPAHLHAQDEIRFLVVERHPARPTRSRGRRPPGASRSRGCSGAGISQALLYNLPRESSPWLPRPPHLWGKLLWASSCGQAPVGQAPVGQATCGQAPVGQASALPSWRYIASRPAASGAGATGVLMRIILAGGSGSPRARAR